MRAHRLTLALVLFAAMPAAAEDACLSGASLLTDEHALASLRDSTESACPCASYTGTAGHDRRAYQSCAGTALHAALDAGNLRKKCRRTATAVNRGAICGSGDVACGRVRATGRKPISCRLRPGSRCTDGAHFAQHACGGQTYCADVVDWTAGTCVDPRTDGPFAAGVRVITFTKPSVVDPSQQRTLDTVIWYPAPPGSGPLDTTYAGVRDAPLDGSRGPYPLLMFSHGSCGYPLQSTFFTPLLATYGFVVVAPPHPGNTLAEYPSCSSPQAIASSAQERPQDIIYVLDQMLAANGDAASPFFGAIDPARLGMSGHSFGGYTTYRDVALDARFKIAMPLAPAVPGSPALTIPSLNMIGQIDTYVSIPAVRTAYANASPPKFLVEIPNTGHFAFSNGCFPSPDCNPPTTLTQNEAHAVVLRWVLPFLELYLAGDTSFAPFLLPPAPPSVVLEAAP